MLTRAPPSSPAVAFSMRDVPHGVPPPGARNVLPRVCAGEMYAPVAPSRDDGPILHAANLRVTRAEGR